MYYDFDLVLPANTAKANAVKLNLPLAPGIINHVAIGFPPGPAALAHVQIFILEHQAWPTNPDSDFAWDDFTLEWDDYLPLSDEPFALSVRGWNTDSTFAHTITLRFGVVPPEVYWRTGPSDDLAQRIARSFKLVGPEA
mgnify:FL=1